MKQLAVEWLSEKLKSEFGFSFSNNILDQAKEMEKQQIIDARVDGVFEGIDIGGNSVTEDISKNHEIYYNEIFNK